MARPKSSPASRLPPPSKPSPPAARERFAGDESELVVMGRVVGAFGVQGWVKVKSFTAEPGGLAQFDRWLVRGRDGWHERVVEDFALHSKGPVAKLAGCDARDGAQALRGSDVAVRRAQLGDAGKGSLFWVDLVGLEVVDLSGERLGHVEALFEAGDTSVMVVAGVKERMIPFVPEYVKAVDAPGRRITVDWKADYDA